MTENGLYLYCFARADSMPVLEGVGLDNQNPLCQQRFQDISAILSEVSFEEFSGPSAEAKMNDLSWVAPRASRHEEVIVQVMRSSPVLPVRFGTIFSSLQSLKTPIQRHHDAIINFLDQVADKEEWVLKGMVDREKAKSGLFAEIITEKAEELAALAPGLRYLREQRIRAETEKDLNRRLKEATLKLAKELQAEVSDFCEHRLLSREITGRDCDMIFNWAFLVSRRALPEFQARIEQASADYANQGLLLELTGPWPPYSFAPSLEPEADS